MATPSSDATSSYESVFVETNLETRLGFSVSGSDTVAVLKRKILIEHPICFPEVGEIEIHAVKAKRRGYFYHLPDSVNIHSAFNRVASSWYLYVDASTLLEQRGRLHCNRDSGNQQDRYNVTDNPLAIVVSDVGPSRWLANLNGSTLSEVEHNPCMNQEIPIAEHMYSDDSSRESSEVLMTELRHTSDNHCKTASMDTKDRAVDITMNGISSTQCNNILLEESMPKKPTEKKSKNKKPSKKRKDAVDDLVLKESDLLAGGPSKDTLQQQVVVPLNSLGNAENEAAHDVKMENGSVVRKSSSDARKQLDSEVHKTNDLSKGIETLAQQAEGNNDKSENGAVVVQSSNLLGEISEHMAPAKKKRKRSGSGVQKTNNLIEEVEVVGKHVNDKNDESEKGIVDVHCSKLLEDAAISMQSSPAKKKRKVGKNNSNKDATKGMSTPEHSLGEIHKSKNASLDGLDAECTEDIHSLRTSSSTGKKKRKSKSTDPHKVVAAVLSPVRELREESTGVVETNHKDSEEPQATGVGESLLLEANNIVTAVLVGEKHDGPVEVSKSNVLGSLDADMGDANACNLRVETDVPEEPAKSGVNEMDTCRSGHVDVNDLPLSTVQEPNGLQVTIELVDDHKRIGANQTDKTVEGRDVYKIDDPKDETPEPASSCKKTKKSKRTSGQTRVMSSTKIAEGLVTGNFSSEHTSIKGVDSGMKSESDGRILSQMEGNDASELQSEDHTSPVATDGKTEKRTPTEVTSLQKISKSQAGGENEDGKKKRKTRKQQTLAATDLPAVQEKEREQNVGFQSPVPSSDVKLVDFSSEKSKKRKSSKAQSLNPNLVPGKDTEVVSSPLHTELLSGTVDCSQVSSPMVKGSGEGRTPEVVGNAGSLNNGFIEEGNSQKKVSCESDGINFKEYFVHGQDEDEAKSTGQVVDNKINREKKSDRKLKDKKTKDKLVIHSASASPDQHSLLKVNENRGNKEKEQGGKSSTSELYGSSLKNESSKPLPQSKKKLLKTYGSGILPVPPNNSMKSNSVSKEARQFDASAFITPMGKNSKAFAKPKSGLKSPKVSHRTKKTNEHQSHNDFHPKSIREASGSRMGEVVNGTKPKKSLLAISNAIFKEDSSMDSHDHQVRIDSDASTRSVSDNLSSSDGEGSYNSSEREEDGGKSSIQSHSAVPKNMKLDTILRGSSRYKKAKLTASQSQPDDDDIDFVPDSQAQA